MKNFIVPLDDCVELWHNQKGLLIENSPFICVIIESGSQDIDEKTNVDGEAGTSASGMELSEKKTVMDAETRFASAAGEYKKMADLPGWICDFYSGYPVFDAFAARTFSVGQRIDGTQLFYGLAGNDLEQPVGDPCIVSFCPDAETIPECVYHRILFFMRTRH